jgi:GT2 family glycosyltransferase
MLGWNRHLKSVAMLPSLYAIIVNWNLPDDTSACVESVLVSGVPAGQVIVVDNGSTDDSVQIIKTRFGSAVTLVASQTNLGFAGGNNIGIQRALAGGAAWVLLLNNDTVVDANSLVELERAADSDDRLGIVAPMILYYSDPERIWYLGDRLLPGLPLSVSIARGVRDRGQFPALLLMDFVSGCGMLVKREVFEKVGDLDTRFFMYGEDADFCWRTRSAGFRLACAPRARMWHKVSLSASRDKPTARYMRTRNQVRFYRMYSRAWQIPVVWAFTTLRMMQLVSSDVMHGDANLVRPLIRGWSDGWWTNLD